MSGWLDAAECYRAALWAAGLCALGLASAVLALLPRDREGANAGLAAGIAFAVFVGVAWYVVAMCGIG